MRIVYMGTPEVAVQPLRALVENGYSVVGVYTQPDRPVGRGLKLKASPVKEEATKLGLPVFQPERLSLAGEFEKLQELQPDLIVVVAYGQILKSNVLQLPKFGCMNIHFSLLPRWRGAAPMQWAILAGDTQTGVTTMRLVEKLDAGDIYLQEETPISLEDTVQSLGERLIEIGSRLMLQTIQALQSGSLQPRKQDEAQVTLAAKLTKEMEWLDCSESASSLDCKVRALNPWPGTSIWVGERLRIKKTRARTDTLGPSGTLFEKAGMLFLGTDQGSLEILLLQQEGKKESTPLQFIQILRSKGQRLPLAVTEPPL